MAVLTAVAVAVMGAGFPAAQAATDSAAAASGTSASAAGPGVEQVCSTPKKGEFSCFALRRTDIKGVKGVQLAAAAPSGFGPADLQSAYNLPADGGAGQTIAIVDAYDNPNAEADLAVYRQQYGLSPCTTANGCFQKVDQRGGTNYPAPNAGWAGEISLDLDMVSAAAPNAHILLVEADSAGFADMGAAVDQAVAMGAKYVSNSYGTNYTSTPGSGEDSSELLLDAHYNHPGVAVVASSGDSGYGVSYPAASQYVTAIGGTALKRDTATSRGWSESVWNNVSGGTGSGCSLYEPKPAFQTDTGCRKRSVADVAAVADPATGVAVYHTYGGSGWAVYGGTSASAPIIAGVYATAGTPVTGSYPNSYPYQNSQNPSALNDVTTGANGSCNPGYFCTAGPGYDGPTGLGTPNGTAAFRSGPHGKVSGTVTDTSGAALSGVSIAAGDYRATTDAKGHYSLVVPPGTYDVTASAYGYATKKTTGVTVLDGGTLNADFALAVVPSRTVTGKVTDGSGHGWPLYAKITVDGVPGAPLHTDPYTGAYSIELPQDSTYTLHIDAQYPGYQPVTKQVTVGGSAQTVDVAVPVDAKAARAPGYAVKLTGPTEPFDSTTSAPEGWSVVNADGTTGGWEFGDPGKRGNRTGGSGGFAVVDSYYYGSGKKQDSSLLSPVFDLTGYADPKVAFDTQFLTFGQGLTADIDVTTDGGATWTNVWKRTATLTGPSHVEVPLTAYAGKSGVQLRFHFTGSGYWWALDNVFVGQRTYEPVPGGLVAGTVTDANTGEAIVGATVVNGDAPQEKAITAATPDDPALGDGFYWMFTTKTGDHAFTASRPYYSDLAKTVNVAPDSTTQAAFALKAGRLTITPGSVNKTLDWGKQTTQDLTVKNTGGAPATLTLGEQSGGFHMQAAGGAPLNLVKGTFSPLATKADKGTGTQARASAATANAGGDAWQLAATLPTGLQDNAVDAGGGKLYSAFGYTGSEDTNALYAYDPGTGSWSQLASAADTRRAPAHGFIGGKLYAVGGWGVSGSPDAKLEVYDPASNAWTTKAPSPKPYAGSGSAVLDGKLYVVGGCATSSCGTKDVTVYDPTSDSWSQIAPYPEPVSWAACGGIGVKLYCAGGVTDTASVKHAYVYDPAYDSWSAIADLPIDLWGSAYSSANGLLLTSGGVTAQGVTNQGFAFDPRAGSWTALPNANLGVYRAGGAAGFYKVGGSPGGSVTPVGIVEVLPGYDQVGSWDVSWLSTSQQKVTLQPGASTTVTVTLNASVPEITQPGDYTAALTARTDTPYQSPEIDVTMHVNPPASWGKYAGTVLGADGKGGTVPLAGATVQINGSAASYTVRTAKDGTFALWLDSRNNPLTVTAFKDGYQSITTSVKIKKGETTTGNFTLKKAS